MNKLKKLVLKLKNKNVTYKLPKEAQLVRKVERIKLTDDEYLINDNAVSKEDLIKDISRWVRSSFIFQNLDVHLPNEVSLPVETNEKLTDLNRFKPTGMRALEYLVVCVLSIGIKIGREMERNNNTKK